MKKSKSITPKKHKVKIGDCVNFRFAGINRTGEVIELTFREDGHATYTVKCKGIIYPSLGLNGSMEVGNVYKH